MPKIHLTTFIAAPLQRVFDLSRSIDLHRDSMKKYDEQAVEGRMNGLIEGGESVSWTAKHLFKVRKLTSRITDFDPPNQFTDVQVKGAFKSYRHEHHFRQIENGTIMIDQFFYEVPYGGIGKVVNRIYLQRYLERLFEHRNNAIKQAAETDRWKNYLT